MNEMKRLPAVAILKFFRSVYRTMVPEGTLTPSFPYQHITYQLKAAELFVPITSISMQPMNRSQRSTPRGADRLLFLIHHVHTHRHVLRRFRRLIVLNIIGITLELHIDTSGSTTINHHVRVESLSTEKPCYVAPTS